MQAWTRFVSAGVGAAALAAAASAQTATVGLNPVSSCVNNHTVVVNVDLSAASDAVVGGQFFLSYDSSLTFVSAVPGGSPWNLEIFESVNTLAHTIDYAVGVTGGGAGASSGTMAVLTFSVADDQCSSSGLAAFRSHSPATTVTNNTGGAHTMTLSNLGKIQIDATAPSITCPSNVTVNADAGGCTAAASNALLASPWTAFDNVSIFNKPGGGDDLSLKMDSLNGSQDAVLRYVPPAPLLYSALATLSADYNMQTGCFGGGSPRFQVRIDQDGDGQVSAGDRNLFVYWGTAPSFNDCPPIGVWSSTGNFIGDSALRFDTSQFPSGTFYDTYAHTLVLFGGKRVLRASIVMDSGWLAPQSMLVDNVTVNGDVQRFSPFASDNCDTPTVTGVRSDSQPLTSPYPTGTTTITWTATDDCGNNTSCNQTVTVNASNTLDVTVQLESVSAAPFQRCITFGLRNACGAVTEVSAPITFTGGVGSALVDIPCGTWTCLTARDKRHTLRSTDNDDFGIDGTDYVADFTGGDQLIGGNLNDDSVVDILDFGAFVGQYGVNYGTADTTCSTAFPHADISGNGIVFNEDFTYIQIHFLNTNELDCCGAPVMVPPVRRISIVDLQNLNAGLSIGDLNHDGWLDEQDMVVFAVNGGLPCRADWNGDGAITPADIAQFVNTWFSGLTAGTLQADLDGNGLIQPSDMASFVNTWLAALGTGC